MALAAKRKPAYLTPEESFSRLSAFVPQALRNSGDAQTLIPRLAKDEQAIRSIKTQLAFALSNSKGCAPNRNIG
jgi:hypothetical protein